MPLNSQSWLVGLDTGEGDVRYVRRFVGAVLTADSYLGNNTSGVGQEVVLSNPNGPVMGALPQNTAASLLAAGDGIRAGVAVAVTRIAAAGTIDLGRANTSYAAPSQTLALQEVGRVRYFGFSDLSVRIEVAGISCIVREPTASNARSSILRFQVADTGVGGTKNACDIRGGGSGVWDLISQQGTMRIVGGGTLNGFRDSANTIYLDQWTDAGVRRIIGPIAIGSVAADPVASALVEYISTTRGILYPRMTEVQRDAIAAPASGLVIYNTTTGKLNLRGAAAWEAITSV